MPIPLRKEIVRQLIDHRFDSDADFLVEWEHRVSSGVQKSGKARDRATFYRWLNDGLPSKKDDVFGFAAVLDVDPIALVDLQHPLIKRSFGRERRLFQRREEARSLLAPLWMLYDPSGAWPNEEISRHFYNRSWATKYFEHEPSNISNIYAGISLTELGNSESILPRVYHFAYRRATAADLMWRPYGTVVKYSKCAQLIAETGYYQEIEIEEGDLIVETFFGPGPACFRIACLHDFNIEVKVPSRLKDCLRFPA